MKNLNDLFAEVADLVPGFGGMYFEGEDLVVLRLQDPAAERATLDALLTVFGTELEELLEGREVRVLEAAYDWRELKGWYEASLPVWDTGVITSSDINEGLNRIVFGIEPGADSAEVRAVFEGLDVPADAVILEERTLDGTGSGERLMQEGGTGERGGCSGASLTDDFCPLIGGIAIDGEPSGPENLCTLGFVVRSITSAEPNRFVTNSHCTQVEGGGSQTEGTQFYQPIKSQGRLVGQEILDPNYSPFLSLCPAGFQCRYSDAALVELIGQEEGALGLIARPTGRDDLSLATGQPPYNHRFEIVREGSAPFMGLTLDKVGIVTGWTRGEVTETCITSRRAGNIAYLCQARIDATSLDGD